MTRKPFVFAALFCLLITGCDFPNPPGKLKKDNGDIEEFRIGVIGFKEYYNAHGFRPGDIDAINASSIYNSLIDHQLNNDLAENITFSENGVECVAQLRKDVFFHDGTKLTPEDVIYSLNHYKKVYLEKSATMIVHAATFTTTAEKMGEGKLLFKSNIVNSLKRTLSDFAIISERHEEIHKNKPPLEYIPNGTGPMRFANYDGSKGILTLERFDRYFGGIPKIKKMVTQSYPDGDSLEMALLRGEINYSTIHGNFDKRIKDNDKYAWIEETAYVCDMVMFNTLSPKLKDWRVRKALSLLIDRNILVNDPHGLAGQATPTSVAFSHSHPPTKPVNDKPDPARAMELFRQAGYKRDNGKLMRNGERLSLKLALSQRNLEYETHYVKLLGKMWEGAGINIIAKEIGIFRYINYDKDWEVMFNRNTDIFALYDNMIYINNKNTSIIHPPLNSNFSDPELERLFLECSKESRDNVLLEKKSLIQKRIKDMCPIAPLFYKNEWMVLGGELAKDGHVVKAIKKDPFLLTHLSRYVK